MIFKHLADLCDITIGRTPSRSVAEYCGGSSPWVSISDMRSKYISETKECITDYGVEKARCRIIKKGTLLLSFKLSIGKLSFADRDLYTNEAIAALQIKDKENLYPDYLFYALRFIPLTGSNQAAMGKTLNSKSLAILKIPIPENYDDQVRIAGILSRAELLIEKRKESIRLLDDFLKSTFLDMFGDPKCNPKKFPITKLKEFYIDSKNGTKCGPFGSVLKKEEYVKHGIPVWNMDNISLSGRMIKPFRMWITSEKYQLLKSYSVKDGDVIISRAGTVGKMCVVMISGEESIISTNLIRVRFGEKLLPIYFVSLMNYCKGRVGRLKTGPDGTFTHMNTGILDSLSFPYPPLALQKQFAFIVDKVEIIKAKYQVSLEELERLYGS
ncbi:MAG: restriction endonuclease subunit S, partial [Spirochaetales bacterium]|nr:restriction endonuclease subunit S [Spirochaetales bacterium]